ncbi:MAG: phosphate ABC transporter permease subunit PstC [Desulfobacca sp.]|uniref:phosphate ABC transporter permease subunit PstC n=1 Tax=Desulfobacca sp. TaxID=2067990 RepID=UPI00404ABC54
MPQAKDIVLPAAVRRSIRPNADAIFKWLTVGAAVVVPIIIVAIFWELLSLSWPALAKFGWRFFISEVWNPVTQQFGAASSIYGTVMSTLIAMVLAVPMSIVIALFLVELAPPWVSKIVGNLIELLAAIPSIIYGMWGLFVFAPFMATYVQPFLGQYLGFLPLFTGPPMGIGMLTAGIILAFMILPFITAICRDVFALVPAVLKESGYGVGATTWEVTYKITLPYGIVGVLGGIFLGLGRALGETMAVTFVIGNSHKISLSFFAPGNSIASSLANEFAEATEPIYLSSLIALGLVLFILTFLVQIISQIMLRRLYRGWSSNL